MGRFDALTELDERQPETVATPPPPWPEAPLAGKNHGADGKKPANPQAGKPANLSPTLPAVEKPEKYTTRLEPSLVKKIRLEAIEKEVKDYEVVRTALNEYFAKQQ